MRSLEGNNLIAVDLTTRCAAVCKKCYRRYIYSDSDMQQDTFDDLMASLSELENKVSILLGTGEALLLPVYIKTLTEWSHSNNSFIHILTTGVCLSERVISILKESPFVSVQVTFDGFINNDISEVQKIDFEKVKRNVRKLSLFIKPNFNYTLYNHNVSSLFRLIDFAVDCGVKEISVTPVKIYDLCYESLAGFAVDLQDSSLQRSLAGVREYAKNNMIDLIIPAGIRKSSSEKDNQEWAFYCSRMGFFRPIVRTNGSLAVCWGREDISFKMSEERGLFRYITSKMFSDAKEHLNNGRLLEICSDCIIRHNISRQIKRTPIVSTSDICLSRINELLQPNN